VSEIIAALPALSGVIEKGGIIGLLLIVAGVLCWEIVRGRKALAEKATELAKVYAQRDKWRLAFVKCKAACDSAGVKVDLTDLAGLLEEGAG
jgi:hypothetical protein